MSVTIREVAREASVSVATVSRVLNGKGPVRPETERRIRKAAKSLRYIPHGGARSLITRKTSTLGVLMPELYGEFFSELIRGIDVCARRSGYHLLVSSSHSERSETEEMVRAMRGRVDGLVVLSPDVRPSVLRANLPEKFPVVLLNSAGNRLSFDSLNVDNFGGATAMVRHLVRLGHRRIAFIQGPSLNRDASERLRGYREAIGAQAGLGMAPLEIPGDFREESGYEASRKILALKQRPSAIFAANDSMAIGLLCAFQETGVRVPEDFAIAGFDDIPIARYITPPLTSVRVPISDLGARATERLVEAIAAGSDRALFHETLPTTLVVRASCGENGRARARRLARSADG
ncbi:MAG: LacI family DNA-binding transcriptional regulator [Acidobacteriota bacterium]